MAITGGCLCRAVRFASAAPPMVTRACWCRLCQYLGAGSGTVNVCFPTDGFSVSGETHSYSGVADSGNVLRRRFCPTCGTPLFSEADVRPHLIFVRAGALDDPNVANPTLTIWTAAAPQWACIDSRLPAIPGQPPPAA